MQPFFLLSERQRRRPRALAVGPIAAALAATALTACAASTSAAAEYGLVPDPPLPVAPPAVELDPSSGIANLDGSIVVDLGDGELTFRGSETSPLSARPVGAEHDLRAVSSRGTQAALFAEVDDASVITVVDQDPAIENLTFTLDGLVEPEAFSTDGSILYVIDHQVAKTPGAYRVRPLDLATGQLETIVGRSKVPLVEDMNGVGRRQVWSPDGSRLNTLYIRQTHHHHAPDALGAAAAEHTHGEPGVDGFVHILDLDDEWAHCLDLPSAFGAGELATTALAMSPDGTALAVADVAAGEIAFASAESLTVTHTVPMPDFEVGDDLHLGLLEDALILGSGDSAQWYDRTTMHPLGSPITLPGALIGFTPNGTSALAWTGGGSAPPLMLAPQTSP